MRYNDGMSEHVSGRRLASMASESMAFPTALFADLSGFTLLTFEVR